VLSEDELLSLPLLYRSALSSLSVARATSLDSALVAYLEALCLRGYFYLYGARRGLRQRIGDFFLRDWPAAIRDLWRETWASVGLTPNARDEFPYQLKLILPLGLSQGAVRSRWAFSGFQTRRFSL